MLDAALDRELDVASSRLLARPNPVGLVERYGIPFGALLALELSYDHPPLGIERIEVSGQTYQPAEDGAWAFILPVFDWEIVDVVAWFPNEPERWWRRRGVADVLGYEAVRISKYMGERLRLNASPYEWLRTSGWGAVVLDWDSAWEWLPGIDRILVDDDALYQQLDRTLRPLRKPAPTPEVRIAASVSA